MRKIILSLLGVLLIIAAFMLAKSMIANKQKPKPRFSKTIKTVFIEKVTNKEIPIVIKASGNLVAKNKIELFSEVQGVLHTTQKDFKAGVRFSKNETLLNINSDEFYASLQSQKSNLINSITAIMPDIRLDYPTAFNKWQAYLSAFDVNKTTPELPKFSSEKEKYFVSGKGITTAYFNVKNLEVKLKKYSINAPYNGILTEAFVSEGSLVRSGQKLGEFIDPSIFEMEVSVNAAFADLLKIGNTVALTNLERTKSYNGKVIRVNGKVDLASQTIKVFIEVAHQDLKDGMYLEANIVGKSEKNAFEISRKLLINNNSVYVVKDTILNLVTVNPVYFNAETVVIKGLQNNTAILTQSVPGAFDGLVVKIQKKN
jgi:multidrug efflux pump subunit AcrA (membrane-fusion protein)